MREIPILALIPAWNEASRIGSVIEGIKSHLPVLVVDDGSSDETAAIASMTGATVLRHEVNQGKGVALLTGFDWALQGPFEAVLTLDADGQHDPEEAPKFVRAYEQGEGELIIGRRQFSQMPLVRSLSNPIGSWLLSTAMGVKIYDNQCGYRLYSRRALEALNLTKRGFDLEVEVVIQAITKGLSIGWVDIQTIYRADIKSHLHPIRDSIRYLAMVWYALRVRRSFPKDPPSSSRA